MTVGAETLRTDAERAFVDTNVFVYLADHGAPSKRARAAHILQAHSAQLVVSTQVIFELHNVATRKLGVGSRDLSRLMSIVSRFRMVPADRELALRAVKFAEDLGTSIYNAAILAAAERADCTVLLSEDAALAKAARDIRVVNPFA